MVQNASIRLASSPPKFEFIIPSGSRYFQLKKKPKNPEKSPKIDFLLIASRYLSIMRQKCVENAQKIPIEFCKKKKVKMCSTLYQKVKKTLIREAVFCKNISLN